MAEQPPGAPDADPVAALLAAAPTPRRSRLPWYLGAGAVVAVAAIVAVVILGRAELPDYDDDTRAEFLAACTADGGAAVEPVCVCIYDELVAEVPYDRFALLDEQLRATAAELPEGLPLEVPDDIQAIIDGCVARVGPTA